VVSVDAGDFVFSVPCSDSFFSDFFIDLAVEGFTLSGSKENGKLLNKRPHARIEADRVKLAEGGVFR